MRAEILCIGTELLLGGIVNTNAAYLARRLAEGGIELYHQSVVGDNPPRIQEALQLALSRVRIVLITGGLGPTVDDVTAASIAQTLGRPLVFHEKIFAKIRARFRRVKAPMAPEVRRQAYLPEGARPIDNPVGTAPGIILEQDGRFVIALPGVPAELVPMMEQNVLPFLKRTFRTPQMLVTRTLKLVGLPESTVNHRVKDLLNLSGDVTVGIYAHVSQVDLKITAKAATRRAAEKLILPVEKMIRQRFGKTIFGVDDDTLEGVVIGLLRARRETVCVAESCTGGLVTDRLTDIPGASRVLDATTVTYSNASKIRILSVPQEILKKHGAVSAPCATAMAKGARRVSGTDYAVSLTGICGPAGGTAQKPVGLVFIALATPQGTRCRRILFLGDRRAIKWRASQAALNWLRLTLLNERGWKTTHDD